MGLLGMYQSILATASSLAGMGVSFSAVRQIAEARGKGDEQRIREIVYVIRVLTIALGAVGAATVFMCRESIARWTFGDSTNAEFVGWLSIGIFMTVASQSLTSLLQGYRRIGDQARLQVWSGAVGTALAISAVLLLGKVGVVIFIVAAPFVVALFAWNYARDIGVKVTTVGFRPFRIEARRMLGIGIAVMVGGALQGWALLALRSHITQTFGLDVTGLFQAAWALSFIYMGFMFDAMGKDYYPRLTENAGDPDKTAQLMREQINVAILLAGPIIVAMIGFSPLIVRVLYSGSFVDAAPVIQWMGLGNLLKVVSWPLGFIILAQGRSSLFLALEITWIVALLGVGLIFERSLGLQAVGVAFMAAYAMNFLLLYFVSRSLTGFRFDTGNLRLMGGYAILVGAVFIAAQHNAAAGYAVGGAGFAAALRHSYRRLSTLFERDLFMAIKNRIINKI